MKKGLALGAALCALSLTAFGQEGFKLRPSIGVGEVYDDNLFLTPHRDEETVTRVTPGLDLGYRGTALALVSRYTFDAEQFSRHASLSNFFARQEASLETDYVSSGSWFASATGDYTETHTPGELNVTTGLELVRARAERWSSDGAFGWRFGPRTDAVARYGFSRDALAGGPRGDTHTAGLTLERSLSPRANLTLGYTYRRYLFAGSDETRAHVISLGWARDLGMHTQLKLSGGPRIGDGRTRPETEASLRRELRQGELSLTLAQGQSRLVGQAGVALTELATLGFGANVFRFLRLGFSPGVFRTRLNGEEAIAYRWGTALDWKLARWLSLSASHQFSLQHGTLLQGRIEHNLVLLRLVASPTAPPPLRRPVLEKEAVKGE